jgi:hypothetical protein
MMTTLLPDITAFSSFTSFAALMGTVILMLIMGYGISMDVENLRFSVLDRDQTVSSQAWTLNLAGSRYLGYRFQPLLLQHAGIHFRQHFALANELPF